HQAATTPRGQARSCSKTKARAGDLLPVPGMHEGMRVERARIAPPAATPRPRVAVIPSPAAEYRPITRINVGLAGAHHLVVDEMHVEEDGDARTVVADVPVPDGLPGIREALLGAVRAEQARHLLLAHAALDAGEVFRGERIPLPQHDAALVHLHHQAGPAVGLGRIFERGGAVVVAPAP